MSTRSDYNETIAGRQDAEKTTSVDIMGEEAMEIDTQVARRVLRKIDFFLMPAMVIGKSRAVLFAFRLMNVQRIRLGLLRQGRYLEFQDGRACH